MIKWFRKLFSWKKEWNEDEDMTAIICPHCDYAYDLCTCLEKEAFKWPKPEEERL